MKNFRVFLSFFTNNKIKIVALIVIMVSAIIIISTTIAQYRYNKYTTGFFEKNELKNSICVQTNIADRLGGTEASDKLKDGEIDSFIQESSSKLFEEDVFQKLYKFLAVKNVYGSFLIHAEYNKTITSVNFAPKETYDVFNYRLSSGCWFDECEQSSEYPNAVLCGNIYENVQVGNNVDIQLADVNNKTYTVTLHVIGKVQAPYYTFDFTSKSSDAEYFAAQNKSADISQSIFLLDDDVTKKAFGEISKNVNDINIEYPNFFISFKEDASQQKINEFKDYLSKSGEASAAYFDTDEMVKYMRQIDIESLKDSLPLSLFYFVIATFTLICVSAVIVKRTLSEHYIFYLCGCSRIKSFMIMLCGILSVSFLSAITASVYLFLTNNFIASGNNLYATVFIDEYSYLYIWIYAVAAALISLIIPFFTFRKNTPIELYRKRENEI